MIGILGSGFEDIIERRRNNKELINSDEEEKSHVLTNSEASDASTLRGALYNFLHLETSSYAKHFDIFVNLLVVATSMTFMLETVTTHTYSSLERSTFDTIEVLSAVVFSIEYALRVYSIAENPKFEGWKGRLLYASSFFPIVDLLSFLPYWIYIFFSKEYVMSSIDMSLSGNIVKYLRMLRLLRFEKYTKAFTTFDDIVRENLDVLGVTGFSALLMWFLFSAILYFTERNNPNQDIAKFYKSVPHAMWITLLNLSGRWLGLNVIEIGTF